MTETSNPNNPSTVLPGDSGGPFYQYYNSSNVEAAGWTSGLEELCDQNGNCAPDGNAFFTPVGNVQQYFNLIPAYYCPQGTLC